MKRFVTQPIARFVALSFGLRVLAILLLMSSTAWAAAPSTLGFQGNLAALDGNPVSATLAITFRLYDVQSGGTELWSETQPGVTVSGGNFTVELGKVTPLPKAVFGKQLYLGVQVAGDSEMAPRPPITAASYALRAERTLKNTVLVSAEGTATENGAALIAAFAALPAATAEAPQTVELDAGTFDLGTASLTVPPYVTLVGRGQATTRIIGQQEANTYVVGFRSHSQGRQFTVHSEPTGSPTSAWAIGIHGDGGSSDVVEDVLLSHVTAEVLAPPASTSANRSGVTACMNNSTIEHSTLVARGGSAATALYSLCAAAGLGGNFMTLNDLRLFASGAGISVRGAYLSGGGPWKNVFALVQVDQPTVTSAYGLIVAANTIDTGAGLFDSQIIVNGSVPLATSGSSVYGLRFNSAPVHVQNLHVRVEDITAKALFGVFVYAESENGQADMNGVNVVVEGTVGLRIDGIRLHDVGGTIVNAKVDALCHTAPAPDPYPACYGFAREGTLDLGTLNLDHVSAFARMADGEGSPSHSVKALSSGIGSVVVRNSTLRVLQTTAEEFASAVRFGDNSGTALLENNVLIADSNSPNYLGGAHAASFMLNAPQTGYEFYGNTVRGFFYIQGSQTPVCAGTTKRGVGFLANTCP